MDVNVTDFITVYIHQLFSCSTLKTTDALFISTAAAAAFTFEDIRMLSVWRIFCDKGDNHHIRAKPIFKLQ